MSDFALDVADGVATVTFTWPDKLNGPALAYSTTKVMLTRELDMDLAGSIELEAMTQALLMKSDDFAEFYGAWSEGRKPEWSGR